MKVIFLDIDGVLNSDRYIKMRDPREESSIDETRLPLLRRILEETGAVLVLSTSWRLYWSPDPLQCDPAWWGVGEALDRCGFVIFDRTPAYNGNNRDREIGDWLTAHGGEVESFVILDDIRSGWGDLADRVVFTEPHRLGLTEKNVAAAITLLNTPIHT